MALIDKAILIARDSNRQKEEALRFLTTILCRKGLLLEWLPNSVFGPYF
jgi:hypothetical protein